MKTINFAIIASLFLVVVNAETLKSQPPAIEKKLDIKQPAKNTPTDVIKRYTEELKGLAEIKDPKQKGKKDQSREKSIASKVRQFFDFDELAKQSLGGNWKKQKPSDRKKFSKLFIELVETSYLKRSRNLVADYDVSYINEVVQEGHASVTSRVAQKDANVDITYDLHRKSGKWMIYNITLDNVNLIRNYQSQFNQIIKKKGFKHLVNTMQAKLKSTDEEIPL
ncbi:MAG: ABC transporter substrate-binding protein [Bdellovibrionales bacterium]|nr:ABC transporter substrate-binding protein [Bdellovibrionales bacterium]